MKLRKLLIIIALILFSCSKNENEINKPEEQVIVIKESESDIELNEVENDSLLDNESESSLPLISFIQKKVKLVTWESGIKQDYFYNENNDLELIITFDSEEGDIRIIDSIKYEYKGNKIYKITQSINPEENLVTWEKTFSFIDEKSAKGTFNRKKSRNEIVEELTFIYTFNDNFITSYTEYDINGDLKFREELNYNEDGNLSSWYQAFYLPNNIIKTDYLINILKWNNNGVKIEVSPPWSMQTLPGYAISNNYFEKLIGPDRTTEYDVKYNDNGHIIEYDLGFTFIKIEYFD